MRHRRILPIFFVIVGLAALACSSVTDSDEDSGSNNVPAASATSVPATPEQAAPTLAAAQSVAPTENEEPVTQTRPSSGGTTTREGGEDRRHTSITDINPMDLIGDDLHPRIKGGWKTDFSIHSVPFSEIFSGGVPRDGIPPIDHPEFASLRREPSYMRDDEPVIALEIDGQAKAYPLLIMTRHEIVNDELAGVPVTVTYCPLCNSALVFDRRVGSRVLDFGVSGNLRNSDLIMWDRQTESWWQQLEGEAIVGNYTGTQLEFIAAPVVSWKTYKESFPEGLVLLRNARLLSAYDRPPYRGYDEFGTDPFLFDPSKIDPRLDPVERVIAIKFGREAVAYPFEKLKEYPVVNDTVNGQDIVAFYAGDGTISPFPTPNGSVDRVVGATAVFDPNLDGQKLTFTSVDGIITDEQTSSKWDIFGNAVEGPLAGNKLDAVVHANHFWFAWAAFNPETSIWSPDAMMSKAQ